MISDQEKEEKKIGSQSEQIIIPVIQEQLTVSKQVVDTAKVTVRKRVTEELASINIPLVHEGYRVERVPVNKVVDTPPPIRHEGDNMVIPVVKEVIVVQKRYEIVEEVHVIKEKTTVPHQQEVALKKRRNYDTKNPSAE